jgi:superfamily II DNA/RNA helicase
VGTESKKASLQDLKACLHPGLVHERVVVAGNNSSLLTLTRLLRKELQDYDSSLQHNGGVTAAAARKQRPRVVVFFPDEPRAKSAIPRLRDALWGEHKLCVLLPTIGIQPLTIMEQFKRNETTVMLATANSVRGLDFPALTHVYTLYLPLDDPREYVHLAGRVGRVGQLGNILGDGGHVVSIVTQDESRRSDDLAAELGFEFVDIQPEAVAAVPRFELLDDDDDIEDTDDGESWEPDQASAPDTQIEQLRRYLEDTLTLIDVEGDDVAPVQQTEDTIIMDDGEESSFQ